MQTLPSIPDCVRFYTKHFLNNLPTQPVGTSVIICDNTLTWKLLDIQYELLIIIRCLYAICTHASVQVVTTECVYGDYRVTIYQF